MMKKTTKLMMLAFALLLVTTSANAAIVIERSTELVQISVDPETYEGESLYSQDETQGQGAFVSWQMWSSDVFNVTIDLFNLFSLGGATQANLILSGAGVGVIQGSAALAGGANPTVTADFGPTPVDLLAGEIYTLTIFMATGGEAIWSTSETGVTTNYASFAGSGIAAPGNPPGLVDGGQAFGYRVSAETVVPEPGTLALLGAGLVGLALVKFRRR